MEAALYEELRVPHTSVYAVAKTRPDWTTEDLLKHLDSLLGDAPYEMTFSFYENVRFEPTPALRAKLAAVRKKGRMPIFLRYGSFGIPSM
ncbi:MAG: hypothetical protein HY925_04375 [Elusimicrobia bacterium]|nr:hypothetical protein [Elusimicrobiota bacterium]